MGQAASNLPSDPNALASYLHAKSEVEKSELARALHDVLGGLIVAAMMDLAWIEKYLGDGAAAQVRLLRVRRSLDAAIDLKRQLIEDLRPTLLDNFGLFAALRWHFDRFCKSCKMHSSVMLSPQEPHLEPEAAISVFRLVQEALQFIAMRGRPTSIGFDVEADNSRLMLRLSHDGSSVVDDDAGLPEYASMSHRVARLGGSLNVARHSNGGSSWSVAIPLDTDTCR